MVDVSQVSSNRPGYRDVNIEVAEKRTGSLNVGVAFSSIESVYLFAGVTQSNFDLYDWGSFVGGGQRFAINGRVGTETQDVSVSWLDPWFLDRKLALGTEVFYSNSTYFSDFYEQQNYGFAVSLRKSLGDLDSIKLEYRLERFNIDPEWDAPIFFREQKGISTRSHVELSYLYDSRDAQIFPRKGGKFEVLGGYSGLGGDVKTYNFGVNASYYWNLKWDTIFNINAGYATVEGTDDDKFVPIFEREYLGGPYNMRGFRYRDVAPYNPDLSGDETMGGKTSFFCQFELTVPVIEEMRLAFFYDVGFVEEQSFKFRGNNIASDYGIGIRLNLPVGPLAVDYAIPVKSGNAIDDGGQFQFYLNYSY
jgi:outer membrane protein insertion porin family